ncbi:MAG: ABC transporter permease [Spirochaetia bacterium]|nr:ABC transporter permease [Spirochaetia bacterium]
MGKTNHKWITFLSFRYLWGRERDSKNVTQVLSALGLAAGVLTLITVISVMNGLQMGYISSILEIGSYHVRIDADTIPSGFEDAVRGEKGVKSCVRFADIQVLSQGALSRMSPINVRCVDPDAASRDTGFMQRLKITGGAFSLKGENSVILGSELARYLRLKVGDSFVVMAMSGETFNTLKPQNIDFKVTGIFKTGYYEYDRNLAIMSLDSVPVLQSGPAGEKLGIKLNNLYRDKAVVERLSTITGSQAVSWREYNKAFFGALRMEKYAMMFLICLIFVVIGVNIFNFMRRSVSEKIEDIAVLYSLGVREQDMKRIFITEGAFVGLLGGTLGVALGLLISINLNEIFVIAGKVVSWPGQVFEKLFGDLFAFAGVQFQLFSPAYFYIQEVPVQVMFGEVVFAFFFAFFAALVSAYMAVKKLDVKNPASVLRCE